MLPWQENFISRFDQKTLYSLILASNFLDFKSLYDLSCKMVAQIIAKAKNASEMRRILGLPADYTASELEYATKENDWIETAKF